MLKVKKKFTAVIGRIPSTHKWGSLIGWEEENYLAHIIFSNAHFKNVEYLPEIKQKIEDKKENSILWLASINPRDQPDRVVS